MHFRVFSLRQGMFWGLLKFQIFLRSLKVLIFFLGGGGLTVDAEIDPTYEEKIELLSSQAPWDTQILLCNKNTLLQSGSVYTKKLKRLVGLAGWLTD